MHFSVEELSSVYAASLPAEDRMAERKFAQNATSHFSSSTLPSAVTDSISLEAATLPAWTCTLDEYLRTACGTEHSLAPMEPPIIVPGYPRPFEDILLPFVVNARCKLRHAAGEDYHRLSEAAHISLERSLLFWLAELNALPMQLEFAAFRGHTHSGLYRSLLPVGSKPSDTCYRRFLVALRAGGLKAYLQEYPVLARLMATGADQWVVAAAELIDRLKHDDSRIAAVFNEGKAPGRVTELHPNCSDRHNEGRSVMILQFESGIRLVYKPRDIGLEEAYMKLIDWLNETGAPHTFKTFKVLPRRGYGWAECVPVLPIPDLPAAQDYYRRSGSLLCLVHVLGATDLHLENIIGNGAYPVLIDLETLLHPFARNTGADPENAQHKATRLLYESVIRTGMLPRWYTDELGQAYDLSGLGAGAQQELSLEWIRWKAVNTDDMMARKEKLNMFPPPSSGQARFNSWDFGAEMMQGFRETYHFFLRHRQNILQGPCWNALAGQSIRFVFRPTKVYARLHKNLLQPKLLKNGADRSLYLDKLYQGISIDGGIRPCWPLIALEQEAMEQMDVPHFTTRADTDSLLLDRVREIPGYFQASAFRNACARLARLSEGDLEFQISLMAGTLRCRAGGSTHEKTGAPRPNIIGAKYPLTPAMALEQGIEIARTLSAGAIRGADGSITWIAPRLIPGAEKYQFDPIPHDLYAGSGGIALFFAAMYRLTGFQEYKALTAGTLQTMMQCLEEEGTDHFTPKTAGGFSGWGGVAYSLLRAGMLANEASFVKAAIKAAARITPALIDADNAFDMMHGAAGAILSLAAVHEHTGDGRSLQAMIYAGRHLLQNRQLTPAGFKAWPTTSGAFLTGYSHGAAGIAQALLRLYQITGEEDFRNAALEAIAWEDSAFDRSARNWPDFRAAHDEERRCMSAWCHGAAGIGLARLEAMIICPSQDIERDVRHAIAATGQSLNAATDHVCCGNFGRVELLISASQQLAEPALLQEALAAAGAIVRHAADNGGYRYHPAIGYTPTFFQGLSGIGYQLLRTSHPDILPSVLTLS